MSSSTFTSPRLKSIDSTGPADFTPAIALGAAAVVLSAPAVGACVIGGLTYSLLQSSKGVHPRRRDPRGYT